MTAMDLRREDAIEFDRLKQVYRDGYKPRNEVETQLVDRMSTCEYRLRRLQAAETRRLDQGMRFSRNNMLGAYEWAIKYAHLDAISRREAAVDREYNQVFKEFMKLRKQQAAG